MLLFQVKGYSSQCSYYHWDSLGLCLSHLVQLFPQPLMLVMVLSARIATSITTAAFPLLWLVGQQLFVCVGFDVPQDFTLLLSTPFGGISH